MSFSWNQDPCYISSSSIISPLSHSLARSQLPRISVSSAHGSEPVTNSVLCQVELELDFLETNKQIDYCISQQKKSCLLVRNLPPSHKYFWGKSPQSGTNGSCLATTSADIPPPSPDTQS